MKHGVSGFYINGVIQPTVMGHVVASVNGRSLGVKDIANFEQMTDMERLQLAEDLIASVRDPQALPEAVTHRLELERGWAEYELNPDNALSEAEFWKEA